MTSSACTVKTPEKRLRIALMSDFFLPGLGGVEIHIYNLAQCLIARGHHVIVITKASQNDKTRRCGIRWLSNCLKVYQLPHTTYDFPNGSTTFPTFVFYQLMIRSIIHREQVDILHLHQSVSSMVSEALFYGTFRGVRIVFTEHSLYGFHDTKEILLNKSSGFAVTLSDHIICVSHAQRENVVLRARMCPSRVSVIPNAVDTRRFTPRPDLMYRTFASEPNLTVVILTRLTYRKGIDMLCAVLPVLCTRRPDVRVIIGGDGPRRSQVLDMIADHNLGDRVSWCGSVSHHDVPAFLRRGHVFMNFSLTESFCIAILEAVACGLLAVATAVGGVPEVLPSDMLLLADPTPDSYLDAALRACSLARKVSPWDFHRRVAQYYSWDSVAQRTERVYRNVLTFPRLSRSEFFFHALNRGPFLGKYMLIWAFLISVIYTMCDYIWPFAGMDLAPWIPYDAYKARRAELEAEDDTF